MYMYIQIFDSQFSKSPFSYLSICSSVPVYGSLHRSISLQMLQDSHITLGRIKERQGSLNIALSENSRIPINFNRSRLKYNKKQ